MGLDRLRLRRTFDTQALAASFPFALTEPPLQEHGCFYGLADSGAPVIWDRYQADNYNSVILARSGAGNRATSQSSKRYGSSTRASRVFKSSTPKDEYPGRLCHAVGGAHTPPPCRHGETRSRSTPLDLPADHSGAEVAERVGFLAELIELLAGQLNGSELAALDRAAHTVYTSHATPLLRDLAHQLSQDGEEGRRLADRLSPYTTRVALPGLFAHPTSKCSRSGMLVCFSLRGVSRTG